jgi:uncharacterized protein (TIGR02996 family)
MARLGERKKTNKPLKAKYTVECYFERAVRFRPDDVVARMLFADYLTKRGEPDQALPQLDTVGKLAGDNPLTHYNLGLLYLGLGRHDKAAEHARRAMDLGFTRPELSDQLKAKGAWPSSSAASAPARTP